MDEIMGRAVLGIGLWQIKQSLGAIRSGFPRITRNARW